MIGVRTIARTGASLRGRWSVFFKKRCLAGFPWFWPARPLGENAMIEARHLVRRGFGRDHHPLFRAIAQLLATAAWPPAVLINLWQTRRLLGREVSLERAPKALWAAMRHNILPSEYFAYGLWHPARFSNVDNYLYSNEAPRLFKVLNQPSQLDPIGDKLAFYELCQAKGIPTPEILAVFAPSETLLPFRFGQPPACDLFVKARSGLGGDGTERFRWGGVMFKSNRGPGIMPESLGEYLATRAETEKRTLLVQPLLSNHPDLRAEAYAPLAAARLVTGRSKDGEVIIIFGFICFAGANQITSHTNDLAMIDVANGQLIAAPPGDGPGVSIYNYWKPNTDLPLALPDWESALQHIKTAHRACPNLAFVGWDVAFTREGPMVLEGNENWCADTYQTLIGKPLGSTKFVDVLTMRLNN